MFSHQSRVVMNSHIDIEIRVSQLAVSFLYYRRFIEIGLDMRRSMVFQAITQTSVVNISSI